MRLPKLQWPWMKRINSLERELEIAYKTLHAARLDLTFYKEEVTHYKNRLDRSDETITQLAAAFYRSDKGTMRIANRRPEPLVRVVVIPDEIIGRDWSLRMNISNQAVIEAGSIERLVDVVVAQVKQALYARFGR